MGKLHELLAVEGDLQGTSKKLIEETIKTFSKPDHFIGQHRHLQMFDAAQQGQVVADEYKEMVTTVPAKLSYLSEAVAKYYDAIYQKELTNQKAVADLVVDGTVIATSVPATFLLGMESRLRELRQVVEAAPTLQPGIAWEKDETQGKGVYRMKNADEKMKTAKTFMHKVLYEATDKHAAQIEKWEEQVPVGKYVTNITCGMYSPADKSATLARVDKLIQAVKKARMQANMVETVDREIGNTLLTYILG
jgi:asparagine synthetase B (glutamine-hydrolysing)